MIRKVSLAIVAVALIALTFVGSLRSACAADTAPSVAASGHFDADAATAAYLATMTPAARARSDAYFEGGYWLMLWDFAIRTSARLGIAPLANLGANAGFRRAPDTRYRWAQTALYAIQYFILTTVVTLPWAAYEGYVRERQYGMSNQGLGSWLGDEAKGLVIALIFGTLATVAIYAVIRKLPKTWWLWGSAVAIGILIFQVAISPSLLGACIQQVLPAGREPAQAAHFVVGAGQWNSGRSGVRIRCFQADHQDERACQRHGGFGADQSER